MKQYKNIFKALVVGCVLAFSTSCEDFLEKQPLDSLSDVTVFGDPALTEAYLYQTYAYMPWGYTNREGSGCLNQCNGWAHHFSEVADNCRSKSGWVVSNKVFNTGLMNASNLIFNNWAAAYKTIYRCNIIIKGLENSPYSDAVKARYNAEARMLRAYMYFDLARRVGDVPLIKVAQTQDDDLFVAPSPQADVYAFAAEEMGAVAEALPLKKDLATTQYGRFTREAAWAYQGRILLYAKKWAESAAASLKVIDSESGLKLNPNYKELFRSVGAGKDSEIIFEILFDGVKKYHDNDNYGSSPRFGGSGFGNPTHDAVKAFETVNGLLPENDPAWDAKNPYANRDVRLAASIQYHGLELRGTTADHSCIRKPDGSYLPYGPDAPLKTGAHSITGYYRIKGHADDAAVLKARFTSWIDMRLGEVYLNYVEAVNQAGGQSSEVYKYLDLIRERAGIKALSAVRPNLSKDELIEEILHERRVELIFENNRYWDLVRYDRAVEVLDGYVPTGMRPVYTADFDAEGKPIESTIKFDCYEEYNVSGTGIPQVYPEHYKFMPIPQSEVDKNPYLDQNPGY